MTTLLFIPDFTEKNLPKCQLVL